jgi:hypothetical protein
MSSEDVFIQSAFDLLKFMLRPLTSVYGCICQAKGLYPQHSQN